MRARRGRDSAGGTRAVTAGSRAAASRRDDAARCRRGARARLAIEDGVRHERDRTYYDTFDGMLREAGLTFTHVDGDAVVRRAGLRDRGRLASDASADQAAVRARAAARTAARHACSRSPTYARCCRWSSSTAASGCCRCSTVSARRSSASRSRRPRCVRSDGSDARTPAAAADHRHPRLRQGSAAACRRHSSASSASSRPTSRSSTKRSGLRAACRVASRPR